MNTFKNIEKKISGLSPELISELDGYLDYLLSKQTIRGRKKLRQDWAGGLKKVKMTSIDLQKYSLDWR